MNFKLNFYPKKLLVGSFLGALFGGLVYFWNAAPNHLGAVEWLIIILLGAALAFGLGIIEQLRKRPTRLGEGFLVILAGVASLGVL